MVLEGKLAKGILDGLCVGIVGNAEDVVVIPLVGGDDVLLSLNLARPGMPMLRLPDTGGVVVDLPNR